MILGAAVVLTTAACSQLQWPSAHPPAQQSTQQPPPQQQTPAAPSATASVAPPKAPKPAASFDPHRLIGLNYDEAASIAGKPADTRDEPPASVWRYRVEECFVDVYFYMDMGTQQFRALAYEVKPSKTSSEVRKACAEMARAAPAKK